MILYSNEWGSDQSLPLILSRVGFSFSRTYANAPTTTRRAAAGTTDGGWLMSD